MNIVKQVYITNNFMALFENILFCMFFDQNLEIRAKALEIIEYIQANETGQNTIRKLDHFEQAKFLNFECKHYSDLMGNYKNLPINMVTMPPLLVGSDHEDLRMHCLGQKEFKIYVNGEEIDFLHISTNNVGIEAQIKWVSEAVSKANGKERQLDRLHITKDIHGKVKSNAKKSDLSAI